MPLIRQYLPGDRPAVRRISYDTADAGRPADGFFPDRELLADLLTGYYTDYEPESLWVAEEQGRVVGYLAGALDTGRVRRIMAWRLIPRWCFMAVACGTLFDRTLRPDWATCCWRLFWVSCAGP
ncbi:MAG: hypothetical protein LC725_05870 [Lentisphaerae bacterium]|nr:hypothetical protein [Lentisphaerota bacterium]